MGIDPLRFCLAVVPLAAYALVLAAVNARRRPLAVSGGSDLFALGVSLSGVMFVGPIELFRPEAATVELGNFIWIVLLGFYGLSLLLVVLVARPRIVIYNISPDQLHPVLAETAARIDPEARWSGSHLSLPRLGVQLHLDSFDLMRNVSLVSSGGRQNLDGWRRLTREVSASLAGVRVKPNPRALGFLTAAAALLASSMSYMLRHPVELAQAVREVLAY
jgi:hypothetical protein